MKSILLAFILVLVVLVLWYVLANNASAQSRLTSIGAAQYVPGFPCPSVAMSHGYCDATGVWSLSSQPSRPDGFYPKLMHIAGFDSAK